MMNARLLCCTLIGLTWLGSHEVQAQTSAMQITMERCRDLAAEDVLELLVSEYPQLDTGRTTITVSCEQERVTIQLSNPSSARIRVRRVDLDSVAPIARARTVALLIVALQTEPPALVQRITDVAPSGPSSIPSGTAAVPPIASDQRRHPRIRVGLGASLASRTFAYDRPDGDMDAPGIRGSNSSLVPMARLRVEAMPWAGDESLLDGIGVSANFAQAAEMTSYASDMFSLATNWREWDLNLRYHKRIRGGHVATELGIGRQRFAFAGSADSAQLLQEVPAVDYNFARLAIDTSLAISSRVSGDVGLEYRSVSSMGSLGYRFAETQISAWGGYLGASYKFSPSLAGQVRFNTARYQVQFRPAAKESFGGTDTLEGLTLGLCYAY